MTQNRFTANDFRIDHGDTTVDAEVLAVGYDPDGVETDPASADCLAKKTTDSATGISRHWLKRAVDGPEAGFLWNPQSPLYDPDAAARYASRLGRYRYEFRKATDVAFASYLLFLRTKNVSHLRQAEREI